MAENRRRIIMGRWVWNSGVWLSTPSLATGMSLIWNGYRTDLKGTTPLGFLAGVGTRNYAHMVWAVRPGVGGRIHVHGMSEGQ